MKRALFLFFCLCIALAGFSGCKSESRKKTAVQTKTDVDFEDAVFAQRQRDDAFYGEWKGTIEAITPVYLVLRTEGKRVLLPKEIVRRIQLDPARYQERDEFVRLYTAVLAAGLKMSESKAQGIPRYDAEKIDMNDLNAHLSDFEAGRLVPSEKFFGLLLKDEGQAAPALNEYENTLKLYWERDDSRIALLMVPIFKLISAEKVLENVSGPVSSILSVLVLFGVLLFAAYKVYEKLIVASNLTTLTKGKLVREIEKIHYEIAMLKKQVGAVPGAALDTAEPPVRVGEGTALQEAPQPSHIKEFILYKVLRLLTKDEKNAYRERWLARLRNYGERGRTMPLLVYLTMQVLYLAGSVGAVIVGAGSVLALPTLTITGLADVVTILILVMLVLTSLSLLSRMYVKHAALTAAYSEYRKS